MMPLLVEAMVLALIGFLCGTLLAYLYALHRRASDERKW
jgi:ABC-type lipoprotein release transport system permease subunit